MIHEHHNGREMNNVEKGKCMNQCKIKMRNNACWTRQKISEKKLEAAVLEEIWFWDVWQWKFYFYIKSVVICQISLLNMDYGYISLS